MEEKEKTDYSGFESATKLYDHVEAKLAAMLGKLKEWVVCSAKSASKK